MPLKLVILQKRKKNQTKTKPKYTSSSKYHSRKEKKSVLKKCRDKYISESL